MSARRRMREQKKEDEPFIPAEPWWRRRGRLSPSSGAPISPILGVGGRGRGSRYPLSLNPFPARGGEHLSPGPSPARGGAHLSPGPSPARGGESFSPFPAREGGRGVRYNSSPARGGARWAEWAAVRLTLRRGAALVVAAAVVAGLAFLVTTDRLAVTRDDMLIQGVERIPADEIYAASAIEGVNIFQIHAGHLAERIRQVPGVADAAVYLRLPHEVTIVVREEPPVVIWRRGETTVWVGANGAAVPARGPAPALSLVDPMGAAGEEGRLRPQVLANLKALQEAGLEVADVYYGVQEGFYFRSPDGWTVYLGHEGPMAEKLAAFRQLRSSPAARNAARRIVDLRVSGRAQIR